MIQVIDVIRLGLEQLIWREPEMFSGNIIQGEDLEHSLLNDLKNMVIDLQNIVKKTEILEERMNRMLLENAKLKLILEDVCQEVSKDHIHKPKKWRKS